MKRSLAAEMVSTDSSDNLSDGTTYELDVGVVALGDVPEMAASSIRQASKEEPYKGHLEGLVEQSVSPKRRRGFVEANIPNREATRLLW